MNRIILVSEGNFDSDKLINSLRRMILDSEKETIKVVNIHDMEYMSKDGSTKTQSFFMGQIVPKDDKNFPRYITYEDENGIQTKDFYIAGFLDEQAVLNSTIIKDLISDEQDRSIVRNNPSLLLNYLLDNGVEDISHILNEYKINGAYSVLDYSSDKPTFYFGTTGRLVAYSDKLPKYPDEDHTVSYYTNSREVMEYLGVDYGTCTRLEKKSRYYPTGCSLFSEVFLSYAEKERNRNSRFIIGDEELSNKTSINVENHVYRLKNKNK